MVLLIRLGIRDTHVRVSGHGVELTVAWPFPVVSETLVYR